MTTSQDTQAICQSRENTTVVNFLDWDQFTDSIQSMLNEGQIWGVYYDENNNIVAEDIWGEVHSDILK